MEEPPFRVIIPARYASTRLPGKPLVSLCGVPMVLHVLCRAREADPTSVVIATDDARIRDVVQQAGGVAVMTSPDHPSGTDRLAEVAAALGYGPDEIVVNLQGDEPLMDPALVRGVARALADHPTADLATLAVPVSDVAEIVSPSCVKVVLDQEGRALYFSRAPIPWVRGQFEHGRVPPSVPAGVPVLRHLGLYAYRVRTLMRLTQLPASPLEQAESLEQLRALENGMRIQVLVHRGSAPPPGVDTPDDVSAAEAALSQRAARVRP